MFQELLARLQEDISTIRSIIQTNEKIRIFLSDEKNQSLKEIKSLTPRTSSWRIYDHCAVITRLYALYESFIEDLIKDWILYLPKIFVNYSDIDKNIRDTHQRGIATLIQELSNKKSRFDNLLEDLSVENVIKCLHDCLNSTGISYKLLPQAFILHDQNLRKEALVQLLANAGISNDWNWIEKHREIKEILREENTAEAELQNLIKYRNEAAHSDIIDNVLGDKQLIYLCDFIEALCIALTELVSYQVIKRQQELGKVREIGKITRWYSRSKACRAKVFSCQLSVGDRFYLVSQAKAHCQLVTLQSIKVTEDGEDIGKEFIKVTSEIEVGLKFDADGKKALLLYPTELD